MKKLFTLLSVGFVCGASAQSIEIYQGGTTDISGTMIELTGGETIHENLDFTNVSGASLDLKCTRLKLSEVTGATDYLCWGKNELDGVCYSSSTVGPSNPWTTPAVFTWTDGEAGLLSVYHVANGNPGTAIFRYYIVEDGSEIKLDSVDVKYVSTVGINESPKVEFSVYPNPATDHVNVFVSGIDNQNYTVEIYSVVGKKVISQNILEGTNKLDVSALNSGVYFYSVLRNNELIETKKLVIR